MNGKKLAACLRRLKEDILLVDVAPDGIIFSGPDCVVEADVQVEGAEAGTYRYTALLDDLVRVFTLSDDVERLSVDGPVATLHPSGDVARFDVDLSDPDTDTAITVPEFGVLDCSLPGDWPRFVRSWTSDDYSRPNITGYHVDREGRGIEATDGHRAARIGTVEHPGYLLHPAAGDVAYHLRPDEVLYNQDWCCISGRGVTVLLRAPGERFPDVSKVLPPRTTDDKVIAAPSLKEARRLVKQARQLRTKEQRPCVDITTDGTWAPAPPKMPKEVQPKLRINAQFFLDLVQLMRDMGHEGEGLRYVDEYMALWHESEDLFAVVMPVRP